MMDERRSEDRFYLNYYSQVTDLESGVMLGYLVDMNTGGMLMIGNIPLEANTPLKLHINLPEGMFEEDSLEVDALAVWCRPDSEPELYRTGLRLRNTSPRNFLILGKLLSNYGAKS